MTRLIVYEDSSPFSTAVDPYARPTNATRRALGTVATGHPNIPRHIQQGTPTKSNRLAAPATALRRKASATETLRALLAATALESATPSKAQTKPLRPARGPATPTRASTPTLHPSTPATPTTLRLGTRTTSIKPLDYADKYPQLPRYQPLFSYPLQTATQQVVADLAVRLYVHIAPLATTGFDPAPYLVVNAHNGLPLPSYPHLIAAFPSWIAGMEDWSLLVWRVHYGLGEGGVPALFRSSKAAFNTAAENLAKLELTRGGKSCEKSLRSVLATTARLRTKLRAIGAFVGWLPLGYGVPVEAAFCEPKTAPAPKTEQIRPDRRLRGAARQAAQWTSPARPPTLVRTTVLPRDAETEYRAQYHVLGPDAAFLLLDIDKAVYAFDSTYTPPTTAATPRKLPSLYRTGTQFKHRGETLLLLARGERRGFTDETATHDLRPASGAYAFEGDAAPYWTTTEAKLRLVGFFKADVARLAAEARHW